MVSVKADTLTSSQNTVMRKANLDYVLLHPILITGLMGAEALLMYVCILALLFIPLF